MTTARVTLFKPSGKYYTEEQWEIPRGATGPYDMDASPDFRRISGGAVLIDSQEPWGYPHLFPSDTLWEPTKWWRAVGPDGELWAESSNEREIRERARPGDTLHRAYELRDSKMSRIEWRKVS